MHAMMQNAIGLRGGKKEEEEEKGQH